MATMKLDAFRSQLELGFQLPPVARTRTPRNTVPSTKTTSGLDMHHLWFKPQCGYVLRFTLVLNKRQVGDRWKLYLRTKDPKEACERRDMIFWLLKKQGFSVDPGLVPRDYAKR